MIKMQISVRPRSLRQRGIKFPAGNLRDLILTCAEPLKFNPISKCSECHRGCLLVVGLLFVDSCDQEDGVGGGGGGGQK